MANNDKDDENLGSFYMGRTRTSPQPKRYFPQGALTTLALFVFAGILWYAYPRGAEKYSDMDVPVVKADRAPIKAAPIDPGGLEVRHQDSTVFDPLEKNPSGAAEQLLPAPEEPLSWKLMNKDSDIKPAMATPPESVQELAPEEAVAPEAAETIAPPPFAAAKVESGKTESGKTMPALSGAVYIQLGSYRNMDGVKKDWQNLRKKYPHLFDDLPMKSEKVDLPMKGVYYRLQAGTMSAARAKEICAALKADRSNGCIVVK